MPDRVTQAALRRTLVAAGGERLRAIELFDVYTGPGTPQGMKGLAYALEFEHAERTLTESESQGIQDRIRLNVADVRDQTSMDILVQDREVIFNLAGQVSHIDSMRDPYTDLDINCRAQLSMLEACRKYNPGVRVVYTGTRQVYGRPDRLPVDEHHLVRPADINGVNKAAGEYYLLLYNNVLQMLRDKKPKPSRELPKPLGMFGVGNAIGFISSIVGAGGGFISVPFMVWSNVKIHNAVATSAALGFPIAAAGTVGYIIAGASQDTLPSGTLGFVYLPALFAVAGGSVLTAPLGAKVAHALNTGRLKRVFALLLFLLAGYMLYRGIKAA